VVFCSGRGGTGRSTLAINTAISLRELTEGGVVLVDADYAAPALDVALNLDARRNIADLLPSFSQLDDAMMGNVLVSHASGVDVLLAPPPEGTGAPLAPSQVHDLLFLLRSMVGWVIVDLGTDLGDEAFVFLDDADAILVSVLPEMVGLRNVRLLLDRFQRRGYPAEKVRLVLNAATMDGAVSRRDTEARLGAEFAHVVPADQALVTHSINRGVPLSMSHSRSAVARAIRKLARQLAADLALDEGEASVNGSGLAGIISLVQR